MPIQQRIIRFLEQWEQHRLRNHLLFWLATILITTVVLWLSGEMLLFALEVKLFYLPIQVLATYSLVYFLLPKFLLRRKYLLFSLAFSITAYLLAVLARIMVVYVLEPLIWPTEYQESLLEIFTDIRAILDRYLLAVYATVIFFLLLKYAKDSFLTKRKISKLVHEKSTTELNFLKSQVHPHFLFNTLNNIYVLALRQSPDAYPVVKKLADMMEYMLLTSSKQTVSIKEELSLIQNYLDLEVLRYGNRLDLQFNHDVDDENTLIAPLLLLSFVENAFKHGVSGDIANPQMSIQLKVKQGELYFSVFNTKSKGLQKDERSYKKGIGVSNVKRQLDLIYKDNYQLDIDEQATSYRADLTIHLDKMLGQTSIPLQRVTS